MKKYPFEEGDDYWTIEDNQVVWSCWDNISEEIFDENPQQKYYKTEIEAKNNLYENNKTESFRLVE